MMRLIPQMLKKDLAKKKQLSMQYAGQGQCKAKQNAYVLTQKDHVRYKSKCLPASKEDFEFGFSCQYMSLGGAKNLRINPLKK